MICGIYPCIHHDIRMVAMSSILEKIFLGREDLKACHPELVQIRNKKMCSSPFRFYRGTANIFYSEIQHLEPASIDGDIPSIWIHGDLHIGNFGIHRNADGDLVFGINDYDECAMGYFVWDIWRAAISVVLLGREKEYTAPQIEELVKVFTESYCDTVNRLASAPNTECEIIDIETASGFVRQLIEETAGATRREYLEERTEVYRGVRRFRATKNQRPMFTEIRSELLDAFYTQYVASIDPKLRKSLDTYCVQDIDVVENRGAGIGSCGQKMFSFLVRGETLDIDDDVIIGAKVATASSVLHHRNAARLDEPLVSNHALRSITGQKALGGDGDPFLGHFRYEGCDYYCRELSPSVMEIPLGRIKAHQDFAEIVRDMGKAIAITHGAPERNYSRNTKTQRVTIDEAVNRARSRFISEVLEIALGYADRVGKDYQEFRGAIGQK